MLSKLVLEARCLEFIWTLLPGVVLVFLGVPSLKLLYETEILEESELTIKIIGHQWYWSYCLRDFHNVEFDSYLKNIILFGDFQVLDTDNHLVIPVMKNIQLAVTSADVLHSWAVPNLCLKVDAVPGRLNFLSFMIERTGVYFGQCSEICGANHSFMPIVVEVVPHSRFLFWLTHF